MKHSEQTLFHDHEDLNLPYLTRQIIPYIGNKRRLLTLIHGALSMVCGSKCGGKRFLDPFAGSGIVSRLAKYLGFEVHANDWEHYSYVLNQSYLTINKSDLENMYTSWGGIDGIIAHLNSLSPPAEEEEYIARFFSPRCDENPDYKTERLFYTRSNGLTIDKIRNELERLYPEEGVSCEEHLKREKNLLLALLLYGAATHTNTSGVFKAYHKGFGGFSADALSRILKPISLSPPVLIDSEQPQRVFREDANLLMTSGLLAGQQYDVVYLDPPYNQHQYGSNYHMLNSIALWDKPLLSEGGGQSRETAGKAAIRKDWVNTRSDYCYRETASAAFRNLISSLETDHVLVSYSTEGIIPFEELIDICTGAGKISLMTNEYVKYRGGKQSIRRLNNNIEFVIAVDRRKKTLPVDLERISDTIQGNKLNLQLKKSYLREKLTGEFLADEGREKIGYMVGGHVLWIQTIGFFRIAETDLSRRIDELGLPDEVMRRARGELFRKLSLCECMDKVQELEEVLRIVAEEKPDGRYFLSLIPGILRKMAHKKYKSLFYSSLNSIRKHFEKYPLHCGRIARRIEEVEELALKRFSG